MPDNLFQNSQDNEAVWFMLPNGSKRVFPRHAVAKMLADKNRGWELCDPEFVPEKNLRLKDDGKTAVANKNANSELDARDLEERLASTFIELKEYAEEQEVDVKGIRSKKGILEALEKARKLY